ncbi:hypothetical protein EKO04_000519 [Ascochyta lentis]|uniref:Uncharacterized protein n=1 Tax=Ascochyta lentis TaxID=205686 RepID=A0A8H7JEW7_9PLEO|nr:hypothetical protein EKO04_000519 [Ascochyta lentis]
MPLLQLPIELFEVVMRIYVQDDSLKNTARARLVCRAFNNCIPEEMLHKAASSDLNALQGSREYKFYLKQHIAGILRIKLLHQDAGKCQFLRFLKDLINDTVEQEWPMDTETHRVLRSQYTQYICVALASVEYKYMRRLIVGSIVPDTQSRQDLQAVAAAAVGNVQILLNNTTKTDDMLERPREYIPSALCAAVAADQTDVVNVILKWVLATVRGPWDTGNWKDMRAAASGLLEALQVAVHTRKDTVGNTILQVLIRNRALGESLRRSAGLSLMEDCAEHGNFQIFLVAAYYYQNSGSWPKGEIPDELLFREAEDLFRRARERWPQELIYASTYDPIFAQRTQVMLSTTCRAEFHAIAKTLLGTDVLNNR